MKDLPYIDKDKYNIIDVVRIKTSYDIFCVGTLGQLFINDNYFCDTLEPYDKGFTSEDSIRAIKLEKSFVLNSPFKAMRSLAIPTGVYDIDLNGKRSSYKKYIPKEYNNCCPLIKDIPGYSGVYIHVGNTAQDTQGCLLVGLFCDKFKNFRLNSSTDTFQKLLSKLWSFKYPIKIRYSRTY